LVGQPAAGALLARGSLAAAAAGDSSEAAGADGAAAAALPDVENVLGGPLEQCSAEPLT
ncbi:unnamed protein product, partial [Prorocentrum cordatum]